MNKDNIEKILIEFSNLGHTLGFHKTIVNTNNDTTNIYIISSHAIQLEIDWRENNIFMFVVYLKDNAIPPSNIIYTYDDGQWCRKYIEDVYNTKRPTIKNKALRYSQQYLYDCYTFYVNTIKANPQKLSKFGITGIIAP